MFLSHLQGNEELEIKRALQKNNKMSFLKQNLKGVNENNRNKISHLKNQ